MRQRGEPAPEPPHPLPEGELRKSWGDGAPRVSILCHTYNHERFIKDTLDGFLAQRTDFPFEIIVHDDCSPDSTQEIVLEYQKNYPSVIRVIFQEVNQFAHHRPMEFSLPAARGEYLTFCEGDDYWTDPDRLQRQVDLLDARPEVMFVGHDYVSARDGRVWTHHHRDSVTFSRGSIMRSGAYFHPATLLFRHPHQAFPEEVLTVRNVDTFLQSWFGTFGCAVHLGEISPTVYRLHDAGVWVGEQETARAAHYIRSYFMLGAFHDRLGNHDVAATHYARAARKILRSTHLGGREAAHMIGVVLERWLVASPALVGPVKRLRNRVRSFRRVSSG